MGDYWLDDTAIAQLYKLGLNKPQTENLALLYGEGQSTPFQTTDQRARSKGVFQIPAGSLRALMHNHPPQDRSGSFSTKDKEQANKLGVPSYISAGDTVFKYDPATRRVEEVLGEFPIEEWKKHLEDSLRLARINVNNPIVNNINK